MRQRDEVAIHNTSSDELLDLEAEVSVILYEQNSFVILDTADSLALESCMSYQTGSSRQGAESAPETI